MDTSTSPRYSSHSLPNALYALGSPKLWLWLIPLAAVLSMVLAFVAFNSRYSGKVHPGVEVLGAQLGGKSPQEAASILERKAQTELSRAVQFQLLEKQASVPAGEFGLRLDTDATVDRALQVGREGGFLQRWQDRLGAWRGREVVAPVVSLDEQKAAVEMQSLAAQVNRPVRDAALEISEAGPVLKPSQVGFELDVHASVRTLPSSLEALYEQKKPIQPVIKSTPPQVTEQHLSATYGTLTTAWSRPVQLSFGGRQWELSVAELREMVALTGDSKDVRPVLDGQAATAWVTEVASQIDRTPRDARYQVRTGSVTLLSDRDGYQTDVAATVRTLQSAAFSPDGKVDPVVKVIPPKVSNEDLKASVEQADGMINQPFRLTYESEAWALGQDRLTKLLQWPGKGANAKPYLNEAGLETWVQGIAGQVNSKPVDASIRVEPAGARVMPDRDGLQVQVGGTVEAIQRAAGEVRGQAALITKSVPAPVQAADLTNAAKTANVLISKPVSVSLDDRSWTVAPDTLRSWLVWEGEGAETKPLLDHMAVHAFVDSIAADVNTEAEDAYITTDTGTVELIPDVQGVSVAIEPTVSVVEGLARNQERVGEVQVTRTEALVTEADLQHAYSEASAFAGSRFYLVLDEQSWYLDPEDLVKTLTFEGSGADMHASVNETALREQIEYWVALEEGTNVEIDFEKTAKDAVAALNSGLRTSDITFSYRRTTVPKQPHKSDNKVWGGKPPAKWIDINLSSQSMAAYEGKKQVKVTLVTSGRPELPTPTGVYSVIEKTSPKVFISPWPKDSEWWYPNSESNYALLFLGGGYYIHDAPWRAVYGPGTNGAGRAGDAYTGSHGCVNVPTEFMTWMYGWASEGTPIVIHYNKGDGPLPVPEDGSDEDSAPDEAGPSDS